VWSAGGAAVALCLSRRLCAIFGRVDVSIQPGKFVFVPFLFPAYYHSLLFFFFYMNETHIILCGHIIDVEDLHKSAQISNLTARL
jgi:hypothetical protein